MDRVKGKIRRALIGAMLALAASPAAAASLNILYRFTGGLDGGYPNGPLVRDAEGNLFGTTSAGGEAEGYGYGVAYRLSPTASGNWQETVLHRFGMAPSNSPPTSALTLDSQGALYGSAYAGGAGGYVFRLAPGPNGGYRYTTLFSFSSTSPRDGLGPLGPLLLDASGDVIGTTQYGGRSSGPDPCDCGVVYSLAPTTQSGGWPETIRYAFGGLPNSSNPEFGVTLGPDGDYYGLAAEGGTGPCLDGSGVQVVGCGTLFRLRPSGTTWIETVLFSFPRVQPSGPYVFGADGALYGIDIPDAIRLVPPKDGVGAWRREVIYQFNGAVPGQPNGALVFDPAGNLYGGTFATTPTASSVVFELSPPTGGGASWTAKTLVTLAKVEGGTGLQGGLIRDREGVLYGTVGFTASSPHGFIFSVTP
ncbi:MAG TPA: choice-of-anchor tandem repeat GloVer-containing protein [Mycobacterium sp.]|nr:choice-of-anchor tandem repeat GloVer-containing protein [Mycobacterium sp.]